MKHLMGLLRSPEIDGGSGTASPSVSPESVFGGPETPVDAPSEPSPSSPEPRGGEGASAPGTQPGNVTMTEDQLAALASKMVAAIPQPAAAPQQQQQWTAEQQAEFERQFNVVRVTPEIFQAVMGVAPENAAQCKALENLLHGVVKQANAMTAYQLRQEMQQREQMASDRFNPVLQYYQQEQAKALETEFFTQAPDLKDFAGLVGEVMTSMKAQGHRFETKEKAIKAVADRVRGYLTKAAPGGQTSRTTSQPAKRTMPTTSMGGRTGSNSSQQPVSGPQAVFGHLDDTSTS